MSTDIDIAVRGEVTGDGDSPRAKIRRGWLSGRSWILLGAAVVLIAVVSFLIHGAATPHGELDADNPQPNGMRALSHTLSDHGVDVTNAHSMKKALDGADKPGTTLAVYDESGLLTPRALAGLRRASAKSGADIVLIAPGRALTRALAPGVRSAGSSPVDDPSKAQSLTKTASGPVRADCRNATATKAGAITSGGKRYRQSTGAHAGATICFPGASGGTYATYRSGGRTHTVIGNWTVLSNGVISDYGNASLSIGTLGANTNLVYYEPAPGDPALKTADDSIVDLLPGWVLPAGAWLILVTLVAMFWRARRLGPLATEDLPVVVHAAETLEGRARLYRRAGSRDRAALMLQAGTMSRLAVHVKLPRSARPDEVCAAVAEATGRRAPDVAALLLDARPATDHDLGQLARDLATLEREVHHQ